MVAPPPGGLGDFEVPVVGLGDALDGGQPDPGADDGAVTVAFEASHRLQDAFAVLVGNPHSVVTDAQKPVKDRSRTTLSACPSHARQQLTSRGPTVLT